MSGEPNAEEIIKAARNRTRKPQAAAKSDSGVAVPATKPEATPEAVSGEPVTDSPIDELKRMGVAAEAASEAVARLARMWGK